MVSRLLPLVGLVVWVLVAWTEARAESESYQVRGNFASGWFDDYTPCGPDGGRAAWGYVEMGENVSHTRGGGPVAGEYMCTFQYAYDTCTGAFLGYVDGCAEVDVQFGGQLSSATGTVAATRFTPRDELECETLCFCEEDLCTTNPAECTWEYCYYVYDESSASVSATFTGQASTYRGISSSQYASPYGRTHTRGTGAQRDALVSVSTDGAAVMDGGGVIASYNSGSFTRWVVVPEPPPPP